MARHISLPQIELDDEPMACAIVSYLDLARSMLSEGASVHEVFGPRRPMVDLLFRSRRETDPHSVCYFACELTSGLEGMEPAARLGLTFMFISLIRVSLTKFSWLRVLFLCVRLDLTNSVFVCFSG